MTNILDSLSADVVRLIAADSYRACELLRLTCKKYHNLLVDIRYVVGNGEQMREILRKSMVDYIIRTISTSSKACSSVHFRAMNTRLKRTEMKILLHECGNNNAYIDIVSRHYTDVISCDIYINIANYDVLICGIQCLIVPDTNYTKKYTIDYIRDILPELGSKIVLDNDMLL